MSACRASSCGIDHCAPAVNAGDSDGISNPKEIKIVFCLAGPHKRNVEKARIVPPVIGGLPVTSPLQPGADTGIAGSADLFVSIAAGLSAYTALCGYHQHHGTFYRHPERKYCLYGRKILCHLGNPSHCTAFPPDRREHQPSNAGRGTLGINGTVGFTCLTFIREGQAAGVCSSLNTGLPVNVYLSSPQ